MSDSLCKSYIDLRGTPCPLNYVRCCLALEDLSPEECLEVCIDKGEPEEMVISGLENAGHHVKIKEKKSNWIKLMVICGVR